MIDDKIKLKEFIFRQINFSGIKKILDVGCGNCDDLKLLQRLYPNRCFELYGVDRIENVNTESINYFKYDVNSKLPFADSTFDLIYSHNLLECLQDKNAHVAELHRLLKSEGKVVCSHTDWDTLIIDGDDKELVRKITKAYAEWKQPWMDEIDPWIGRRIRGIFNNSGFFLGDVKSYSIINTDFKEGNYGFNMINSFEDLVKEKLITKGEFERFYANVQLYEELNKYFFSVTSFIYYGHKTK